MSTVPPRPSARVVARASLPTRRGKFTAVAFETSDGLEHAALVRGDLDGAESVPVRLHSECLTGDALGSLRCDCRAQLEAALDGLGRMPRAILLYMRQEGRGIGLTNKLRAYALQDQGLDTVEANRHLGFDDDLRDYGVAAAMLRALGVRSIELWTNNPRKIAGLEQAGLVVVSRRALETPPNPHNVRYLATKQQKSGHVFESAIDSRPFTGADSVPPDGPALAIRRLFSVG